MGAICEVGHRGRGRRAREKEEGGGGRIVCQGGEGGGEKERSTRPCLKSNRNKRGVVSC